MGKLIGFVLFLIGLTLLFVGLGLPALVLPQSVGAIVWKVILGLVLLVAGFAMVVYSGGERLGKFMAGLLGLSGLGMLAEALLPTIFGFPLFGSGGIILRVVLGIIFCALAYLASELSG
jgi:hypothetical protein